MHTDKEIIKKCKAISNRIRKKIIEMAYSTGKTGAHIGGSLSMVELLACLYCNCIHYNNANPLWEERDRVILSKGHGALALYPALAEAGIIDENDLLTFKQDGSKLGGHPSLNGLAGIEFASGSLGQGLSLGIGTCLGLKRKNNNFSRVFVFLGDGECNEGSVWEAAASASHFGCNQLKAIIDVNHIQYDGFTSDIMNMESETAKWKSFGWEVLEINGHKISEIIEAYNYNTSKPLAILANTIKGKGISFAENNWRYHNAVLTKELYEKAMSELEQVA